MLMMYDSTIAADIPLNAEAVAGYIDGKYRWSNSDWARFPHAAKIEIAVSAFTSYGHVLDVEFEDATPQQAPGWAMRRRAAGADPVIYCNRSNMAAVKAAFASVGIPEPWYWLATLDGSLPWGTRIAAIQYQGENLSGGHYDKSMVQPYFPGISTERSELMLILSVTGSPAKWLLIGSELIDIDSSQTLQGLTDAGVKTAIVSQAFVDGLRSGPRDI